MSHKRSKKVTKKKTVDESQEEKYEKTSGLPPEEKLDLLEKIEELNYEISHVIFVTQKNGLEALKFVKMINYLGYPFYVYLDGSVYFKEIKGIKEEKYFEVPEEEGEKYRLILDNALMNIIVNKCIGCNIHGLVFECNNGISFYSCTVRGSLPQEKIFIKVLEKKFLHVEETRQVVSFLVGDILENEDELNFGDFKCPIAYPVIHISDFLNEDCEKIESIVKCSIRSLRNSKLNTEEERFKDFTKTLSEIKENFLTFEELKTEIIKQMNLSIDFLERESEKLKMMINKGRGIDIEKIEDIRYQLKRRHELVVDIIKTFCIVSGFNKILKWVNEQFKDLNKTLTSSDLSRLDQNI
jgi:hypothetical protein